MPEAKTPDTLMSTAAQSVKTLSDAVSEAQKNTLDAMFDLDSEMRKHKLRADIFASWISELVTTWPTDCKDCGICVKCRAADALVAWEYPSVPGANA